MRPPSVHATPACTATPAGCPCDVARLLHGPHRVAARLVMILLSCQRWPPAAIAELLGYDPATVRRWIHRYNQWSLAMRRTLLVVTAVLLILMLSFAVTGCRKSSENKGGGGYLPAPRSTVLTAVA